jgi:hypothetical protein
MSMAISFLTLMVQKEIVRLINALLERIVSLTQVVLMKAFVGGYDWEGVIKKLEYIYAYVLYKPDFKITLV